MMDLGQADPLENEMATHFSILFFFLIKKKIYLAASGLICGMWDVCCSLQVLQLWQVGSSSLTRDQTWAACIGSMQS